MAIINSNSSAVTGSPQTISITLDKASGNNRAVCVLMGLNDSNAAAHTATFDPAGINQAMTLTVTLVKHGTQNLYVAAWYLLDADLPASSGAYNVDVTYTLSDSGIQTVVHYLEDMAQEAPEDSGNVESNSTTNPSATVAATAGAVVMDTVMSTAAFAPAYTADSPQTEYIETLLGSKINMSSHALSETTMSWTTAVAKDHLHAFVSMRQAGVSITSTDTPVARGETSVAINGANFGASQGSGTVTYGTKACTVTSWADTLIQVTIPTTIALQHDTTGYTFIVTADDASSDTSSAVPFNEPAGWDYTDLISPVTTLGSILYGYTGDTPVTGDQAVYTTPTSPTSIGFTVEADGEWILDSAPTVSQTVSVYVIQADGTIGDTGIVTYSVGGVSSGMNASLIRRLKKRRLH